MSIGILQVRCNSTNCQTWFIFWHFFILFWKHDYFLRLGSKAKETWDFVNLTTTPPNAPFKKVFHYVYPIRVTNPAEYFLSLLTYPNISINKRQNKGCYGATWSNQLSINLWAVTFTKFEMSTNVLDTQTLFKLFALAWRPSPNIIYQIMMHIIFKIFLDIFSPFLQRISKTMNVKNNLTKNSYFSFRYLVEIVNIG